MVSQPIGRVGMIMKAKVMEQNRRPDRLRAFQLRNVFCIIVAACVASVEIADAAEPPLLKPESGPWDAGSGFSFDKTKPKKDVKARQSLSGIACPANASGQRLCLVVFDEGIEARYAVINDNSYAADNERVVLRKSDGELDAEGAATDGRYFYVTGSHSAKRKNCDSNPDSRRVIRFAVDSKTGRALRKPAGDPKGSLVEYKDSDRLWAIMASLPQLKNHVGEKKCLGTEPPEDKPKLKGQRGANIEGLAVKDSRLYFGFRGPAEKNETLILTVDANAVFEGGTPNAEITRIVVGERRGIRDLHAVRDGILVLAGPDDDTSSENRPWILALWDGKSAGEKAVEPKVLGQLDLTEVKLRKCDKELKPEALAVLEDTAAQYRIVVLSDGMCDGGPLSFKIPR
jgi:hypothetical protein